MVFRHSILYGFIILLLPIVITGCVITPIYYDDWEYKPIDSLIMDNEVEYVYIPKVRLSKIYRYNDWWYTEPYTILIFEDSMGYRTREKIPNSLLKRRLNEQRPFLKRSRDVDSIMKDINKMKNLKDRRNIKRRMRKRS